MISPAAVAAALLLTLAARPASAGDDALQRCLAQKAEEEHFSGVIAATGRGQPIAFIARGRLAGDDSAAVTAQTRFNLGSASKMFTAVAVAQLIDARKVGLDDPIGRFVKGLTPEASAVTVRHLLTHSSGLGDFFKPQNLPAMMKARTASDLLPLIAGDQPAFPPGSRFAYSNSGFALLGILIERVSGQSYGDYLAGHLFAPAGMTDTGLDPKPLSSLAVGMTAHRPGMAPGEAGGPLHPAPGATEGYGSPAGGLFSTALDLQRFAQAFLGNRLTSAASTAALTAQQIVATPLAHAGAPAAPAHPGAREAPAPAGAPAAPARAYGFGFNVGSERGHKWFGHNGGTLGANSEFAAFPEEQWTLTVLSNRDPPAASTLFAYLRALVLDPSLRATCRESAGAHH